MTRHMRSQGNRHSEGRVKGCMNTRLIDISVARRHGLPAGKAIASMLGRKHSGKVVIR